MRTIAFYFEVQVPDAAESPERVDTEAKRLKRHLRELLLLDANFGPHTYNLSAVIKPRHEDGPWAHSRYVIDDQ